MDLSQTRENLAAWDAIATSFDLTRRKPWETVLRFLDGLRPASLVLDAGTGNGRHAGPALDRGHRVVGLDLSRRLLSVARKNAGRAGRAEWVQGAVERLPVRPRSFDAALALASIHHVRGRETRRSVVESLLGTVRPGGRLLLSAWARNQPRFSDPGDPLRPPRKGPVETGDAMLRWTQHGLSVERFVHLYTFGEFEAEVSGLSVPPRRVWDEAIQTNEKSDNFFALFETETPKV